MKKNIVAVLLIAVTVLLAVISWIILPDTVVTQLNFSGTGTTMPKALAIVIPVLLGIGGGVAAILVKTGGNSKNKPLLISAIGIVVAIIMLIVNK